MFGIFKIVQLMHKLKKGSRDPRGFAQEEKNGLILGVFVVPFITNILFSALCFIVGYTDLFGFSLWIGKPFFVFSIFGLIILLSLFRTVQKMTGKMMKKVSNTVIHDVESDN